MSPIQLYSVLDYGTTGTTGLLAHASGYAITAEWPVFPPSVNKTNALSVLSRPSPSPEVRGPKSDWRVLQGHFAAASVGELRSGPRTSGLEGRERGRLAAQLSRARRRLCATCTHNTIH